VREVGLFGLRFVYKHMVAMAISEVVGLPW